MNDWVKRLDYLDWKLNISLGSEDKLAILSRRFNINSEIIMKEENGHLMINVAFKNDPQIGRGFHIFFKELGAELDNDVYYISHTLDIEEEFLYLFDAINKMPTAILISSSIRSGNYHLEFLLNKKDVDGVSSALLSHADHIKGLSVRHFGPSGGFFNVIQRINQETPLTMCEIEISPQENEDGANKNYSGRRWVGIMKSHQMGGEPASLYFTNNTSTDQKEIETTVEEGVCVGLTNNIFPQLISQKDVNWHVHHIFSVQIYVEPHYITWLAFSTEFQMHHLMAIINQSGTIKGWKLLIKQMRPFGQWLNNMD